MSRAAERRRLVTVLGALALGSLWAAPAAAQESPEPVEVPDLGRIRYHDPIAKRTLWLGADVGGFGLPASATRFNRSVWLVRTEPSWALSLIPRFTIGGRHALVWYDAENIRLRVHSHMVQLSGQPLARPRLRDRIALGFETHDVKTTIVDGEEFRLGGVRDSILSLGYGMEHIPLSWLQIGWRIQGRYVWVFNNTQRQLRGSVRLAALPRANHRLSVELVGFYVHREERQFGNPLPRHDVHGQVLGEYVWISRYNVGLALGARYTTSFLSGEAPIYEIREEALNADFGEVWAGIRYVWPN